MDVPWAAARLARDFLLSILYKFAVHDRHPLSAIPCGTHFAWRAETLQNVSADAIYTIVEGQGIKSSVKLPAPAAR
jgi:hypothetical protein